MARQRDVNRTDRRQLTLADYLEPSRPIEPSPGGLNCDRQLRGWLAQAIKDSGVEREMIAARMTVALGGEEEEFQVSRAMLDAFTAPSKPHKFPLLYLPAFVQATGATWILAEIADLMGCKVLEEREVKMVRLARLERESDKLQRQMRELKAELGEGRRAGDA